MDALTRILSWFAPGAAASRLQAKRRLAHAHRAYEAAKSSTYRPTRGGVSSADAVIYEAGDRLRQFARYLDENSDLAVGILDDLVTNVIGQGIGVEPMAARADGTPLDELNRRLRDLWLKWWDRPEVTGELPGTELERIIARTLLRDGEVFVQHVLGRGPGAAGVPYALEAIEPDLVPGDYQSNGYRQGVLKDTWGRPLSYAVYKTHPGDSYGLGGSMRPEVKIVPSSSLLHLKLARRLHQTRGVSVFHAVLTRLDDVRDYEESERIAARVAAAMTAYIKRGPDYQPIDVTSTTQGERAFEMAPGMIWDQLAPGEDVGVIASDRPNTGLEAFRSAMLRACAAGTGARFSAIARDYRGTYSSQRQELVEGAQHYRRIFDYLARQFYLPVWRTFVDAATLAGRLAIPADTDPDSLYRPELRQPALPWIDPKKEIEAQSLAVQSGFRSRWQVIRDLGGDPQVVDKQLAADPLDVRPPEGATPEPTMSDPGVDDEEAA